jgi:hypothetical protein
MVNKNKHEKEKILRKSQVNINHLEAKKVLIFQTNL